MRKYNIGACVALSSITTKAQYDAVVKSFCESVNDSAAKVLTFEECLSLNLFNSDFYIGISIDEEVVIFTIANENSGAFAVSQAMMGGALDKLDVHDPSEF